jgi:hypothetical protein
MDQEPNPYAIGHIVPHSVRCLSPSPFRGLSYPEPLAKEGPGLAIMAQKSLSACIVFALGSRWLAPLKAMLLQS